jgi:hypothetical protein
MFGFLPGFGCDDGPAAEDVRQTGAAVICQNGKFRPQGRRARERLLADHTTRARKKL